VQVSFDSNGGNLIAPVSVKLGTAIGPFFTPVRAGYSFDGWWTALAGGTKLTPETIITEAITYYAHWIKIQPTPAPDPVKNPVTKVKVKKWQKGKIKGKHKVGKKLKVKLTKAKGQKGIKFTYKYKWYRGKKAIKKAHKKTYKLKKKDRGKKISVRITCTAKSVDKKQFELTGKKKHVKKVKAVRIK
jgi:uncharacterized repeat protein (TIGR02543 family)